MPEDEKQYESPESLPKLTEWKNEPTVQDLKKNYEDASTDFDTQLSKIRTWRDNLSVTGSAKAKARKGRSQYTPRLIRKQAEWRYPGLSEPFLVSDEIFRLYPRTAKDKERSKQNELVLNYQFGTKINKVKFIDELVRAVVDEGTAIIQVGWETHEEEITKLEPVYALKPDPSRKFADRYMYLLQLMEEDPERASQYVDAGIEMAIEEFARSEGTLCSIPYIARYTEKTEIVETRNQPVLIVCDLDNLVIDPTCGGDLDKAQFVVNTFETTLSELKKEGDKYTNLDKVMVDAANPANAEDGEATTSSFRFSDNARKKLEVREYWGEWDIDGSGITKPIVAAWIGDVMIRLEDNPYPDKKLPFVAIPYMPKRKSVYGEPDGELLADNQKILGALMRGMIDLLAKSANGQTGMRKDMLDMTNRRKFNRGEDYEFNAIADPRQGVYTHTYPEIPSSAYNLYNMTNSEAESLTGIKAFTDGLGGDSYGKVAAGVKGVLDATSVRDSSILRRLKAGMTEVARKMIAMNSEFLDKDTIIRITDDEFVTVKKDDMGGDYDITIAVSTAEEDNKRAEELAFMLQTIGNNVGPELMTMILADIARLRRMPRLAEKLDKWQPQPDPLSDKLKELELEELMSKIQLNYAKAEDAGMDAQHNRAKVVTEQTIAMLNQVKARLLSSQADVQDLNFIEQESGVGHARDMDKIQGQAHAQAQTKVIEAALKQTTQPSGSRA